MSPTAVPIDALRLEAGLQSRVRLDFPTIEHYAELMRDGASFPPIAVVFDGEQYFVRDGFHRVKAAALAGFKQIAAEVEKGTLDDARWFAPAANKDHGLQRSRADLQRALEMALSHPRSAGMSDRAIAEHVGCSGPTVAAARKRLEATAKVYSEPVRTGRDGRQIDTTNIGKAADAGAATLAALYDQHDAYAGWVGEMNIKLDGIARLIQAGLVTVCSRRGPSGGQMRWYQITPSGCEALGRRGLGFVPEPPAHQYPGIDVVQGQVAASSRPDDDPMPYKVGDLVRTKKGDVGRVVTVPPRGPQIAVEAGGYGVHWYNIANLTPAEPTPPAVAAETAAAPPAEIFQENMPPAEPTLRELALGLLRPLVEAGESLDSIAYKRPHRRDDTLEVLVGGFIVGPDGDIEVNSRQVGVARATADGTREAEVFSLHDLYTALTETPEPPALPDVDEDTPAPPPPPGPLAVGDRVRTRTGRDGEVTKITGALVYVRTAYGENIHRPDTLTKLDAPAPSAREAAADAWGLNAPAPDPAPAPTGGVDQLDHDDLVLRAAFSDESKWDKRYATIRATLAPEDLLFVRSEKWLVALGKDASTPGAQPVRTTLGAARFIRLDGQDANTVLAGLAQAQRVYWYADDDRGLRYFCDMAAPVGAAKVQAVETVAEAAYSPDAGRVLAWLKDVLHHDPADDEALLMGGARNRVYAGDIRAAVDLMSRSAQQPEPTVETKQPEAPQADVLTWLPPLPWKVEGERIVAAGGADVGRLSYNTGAGPIVSRMIVEVINERYAGQPEAELKEGDEVYYEEWTPNNQAHIWRKVRVERVKSRVMIAHPVEKRSMYVERRSLCRRPFGVPLDLGFGTKSPSAPNQATPTAAAPQPESEADHAPAL